MDNQFIVVCKPKAAYAQHLPTFVRAVSSTSPEEAVRVAWREDKAFLDLDKRYHPTKALTFEMLRTYKF